MILHRSQQTNLDHLLPNDVIEYCNFNRFDFRLSLIGTAAQGRWPEVKVWVDKKLVASGAVTGDGFNYMYSEQLDMSLLTKTLEIEYAGKTAEDTITDRDGHIVENQSLTIQALVVNGIDIIDNQTMYRLGDYTMDLPPEKFAYYQKHGHSTAPTHSLDMFENGCWKLTFPIPIITNIVKLKATQELHEKWPDPDLLNAIVNTVNNIRNLEQKLKERK